MKTMKKLLTMVLALCLVLGLATTAFAADETPFTDLTSNWYKEAVAYVYENGLMNGTDEDTFAPKGTVNRAMIVTVLHREAGLPEAKDTESAFDDIVSGKYYYDAVLWAEENGVTKGKNSESAFAPGDAVTREEVATFLYRYADIMEYDNSASAELKFPDQDKVHNYAKEAMQWAVGAGVITGNADGTLNPRGEATRAELAVMLMRFCENIANATGTVNNPVAILSEEENIATVGKDEVVYYSGMVSGMILTIEDAADATVTFNGKEYTADSNGVIIVEFPAAVGRPVPVVFSISSKTAAEYVLNFAYPVGTYMNPEVIWDLTEINCAYEAGNEQGYYYSYYNRAAKGELSFTASCATEGVEYDVILTNQTSYEMAWLSESEDGTVSVDINPNDFVTIQVAVSPDEKWNYPAADITLNGEVIYPVGTMENPEVIWDPTEVACSIEEGNNQGYYYSYYNRAAKGELSFTASCATEGVEYDVILTNQTSYEMAWLSESEDGTVSVAINPGDSVTIQVAVSPDENWNYPAADITLNGEIIYPVGTMENPEVIWDPTEIACSIEEGNNQGYFYTIYNRVAMGELSFSAFCATEGVEYDVILTNQTTYEMAWMSDNEDGTVSIAINPGDYVTVQIAVSPDENWNFPAADITLNGKILTPKGTMDNPEVLTDVTEVACSMEEGNNQGYYYSYTNNGEAGTLTIALEAITEGIECDVVLVNMANYAQAWMMDSNDQTVSIAVGAGETVLIQVVVLPDANWNYPAADITLSGTIA